MLIVGLTGGIASGKSLVSRVFKEQGAHVIDADKIVHDLLAPGQEACRLVIDRFGKGITFPDGTIDRRKLGEIVFHDEAQRTWLNACIHPRVFEAYVTQVKHLRERCPDAVVVLDAALLIETGYNARMDRTVVVYATRDSQIARLRERDQFTQEQAVARIESQMPLDEKRKHADFVIENTGTREHAETQAREVFAKLRQEEARTRA